MARLADAAEAEATEEAYRSDYEGKELEDEFVARRVEARRGRVLAYKGWGLFNLGSVDEAEVVFREALDATPRSYLDVPTSTVGLFWGKAKLQQGDFDGAADLLVLPAIFGGGAEAMEALREGYAEERGGEDGFEDFLQAARAAKARVVVDVSLADYEGVEHRVMDHLDKALLLSFWYPGCAPCRLELPELQPIYEKYADEGFDILVIDRSRDTDEATEFIRENELTYTLVENGEGDGEVVDSLFRVDAFPTSYLIDAEGRILHFYRGYSEDQVEEIELRVREMLGLDSEAA